MTSSITSAMWVANGTGPGGSWTDTTHWSTGSVPGASTDAQIGPSVTASGPWVISVGGNQSVNTLTVEMGAQGTLAITGTLGVAGEASLGYGTIAGAVLDLSTGAALNAGSMLALGSSILVNGATITTGSYVDLDKATATIENSGVWNADTFWVGQFFTTGVSVEAGGLLHASAEVNVGYDNTQAEYAQGNYTQGIGSLVAAGGGVVTAPTLDVVNGSVVQVDSLSAIALGGAATVAGAVAIGSGGTLALEKAGISANVVDDGTLTAVMNAGAASASAGIGPTITGALSGSGGVEVGSGYTLEVGNAAGFTGAISIDPGATLRLDGGTAPTGPIAMAGGTLDLRGLAFGTGQTLTYSGSMLTVGGQTLDVGAGLSLASFAASADTAGGTMIADLACYAAGTRIAAEHGEAAVEQLRPGDRVRTATGRLAPVRWVGRSTLDPARHPHAAPVRIVAGAFGPGLPRRDLLVSGDHAIGVGAALIPARRLVNGATIRQEPQAGPITYVHVELDRHDLLLAEGLPAESFLDTGNRGQFDGETATARVGADPEAAALRIFAERGCLPLLLGGPDVAATQARLRARAAALGWRLVADHALRLGVDRPDVRVMPDGPDALRVTLPPGLRQVRLLSRSFVPAELDPAIPDGRRLGVALAVELDGAWLDDAAFGAGWYAPDAGVTWRWTDGAATLLLPERGRPAVLTLHVMASGARYWVRAAQLAQAA